MTAPEKVSPVLELDPLHVSTPLPYSVEVYPNGFPVSIATNQPAVAAAATESWPEWRQRYSAAPVEVTCLVAGTGKPDAPAPHSFRARRNLFASVADSENFLVCDLTAGFGLTCVTEATVARSEYFRYHFLEAAAYTLLDVLHTTALHAACVVLDGHGILLAGDSGAGKSSLAYACARRGWTYVSDDATTVALRDQGRTVLGNPRAFRFRETAGRLFPEFEGITHRRRGNGKPTIEVPTASLPGIRTALEAHIDYVVFLKRRGAKGAAADLAAVAKDEAVRRLYWCPYPAELPTGRNCIAAIERILGAEAFEMHYRDLDAAVDRLQQLVLRGPQ